MQRHQGKELKLAIRGKGLTQEAAADALDMTRQNLGLYFYREILPDIILQNAKEKLSINIAPVAVVTPDASQIVKTNGKSIRKNHESAELIPYYDIDFVAGSSIEFIEDGNITPEYYMDIPEFRGCKAFRAYSDSMEPLIKSGNVLFAKKITEWKIHLEYGQIYGIVMSDKRRYLKYIRKFKEDAKGFFQLVSANVQYDEFEVPKNKIHSVWLIEGWLNKNT